MKGECNECRIICVDGVVGVGKSSLGKILAKKYGCILYEELVLENPILNKFYYDRKRWLSQIFFLNKRFKWSRMLQNYKMVMIGMFNIRWCNLLLKC